MARQFLTVKCKSEDDADLVCRFLQTWWHLDASDWDIYERHPKWVEGTLYVKATYEKAVYYSANGDGYPGGLFIEDAIDEEDLQEEIKRRMEIDVTVCSEIGE